MKIKLHTTYAGPKMCASAGSIIDLPADEARALIEGKYAELAERGTLETAAVTAGPEQAVRRPRLREAR